MSITVTYSDIDHRYFMRRSKSEIIARMEGLRGQIYTGNERREMMTWTKGALASEAMRLVRALPPPPDPVDTLVQVITNELDRQFQTGKPGPYVDAATPSEATLDGVFDLRDLARAILKSGVLSL